MARLVVVEDLAGSAVVGRGGHAFHVLHFLEGFRRLGHDVLFVEFLAEEPSPGAVAYFEDVISGWWNPRRGALLGGSAERSYAGASVAEVAGFAASADAVVDLAAHYRPDPWPLLSSIRPRILVEQDPGYTHLWAADGDPGHVFGEHDVHFTVGLNVGGPRSAIPTSDIAWRPLPPPVIVDWWGSDGSVRADRFTTVGAWRDYGYLEWEGGLLGPKVEEWEKFIDLPQRAGEPLELTLAIDPEDPDRERLLAHGWRLEDPSRVATPQRYRDYVTGSLGEFSCAKGGYVGTRSGWFSDRTASYLAAGRPAVVQATGFEDVLPTGEGLFAVRDVDEAVAAMREVRRDYERHSHAAREIARAHLDAETICARLLDQARVGV